MTTTDHHQPADTAQPHDTARSHDTTQPPPDAHTGPGAHDDHQAHEGHDDHGGHDGHDKHAGHDPDMFRRLFWWNLLLAVPVLVFSPQIQEWFGYSIDGGWAAWVAPVLGTVIYLWGGQPFLKGGVVEIRNRQPGMMLLIALAITVAYVSSLASSLGWGDLDFWWELAALITVMLLGHWQEMKAIGQAQGALAALAGCCPTPPNGSTATPSKRYRSPRSASAMSCWCAQVAGPCRRHHRGGRRRSTSR
ncbi:MAG: hypothetical protein R2710_14310 [Acidimicrobiales bacterium]